MADVVIDLKLKDQHYLTQAKYKELKAAGKLVVGGQYYITDDGGSGSGGTADLLIVTTDLADREQASATASDIAVAAAAGKAVLFAPHSTGANLTSITCPLSGITTGNQTLAHFYAIVGIESSNINYIHYTIDTSGAIKLESNVVN